MPRGTVSTEQRVEKAIQAVSALGIECMKQGNLDAIQRIITITQALQDVGLILNGAELDPE